MNLSKTFTDDNSKKSPVNQLKNSIPSIGTVLTDFSKLNIAK